MTNDMKTAISDLIGSPAVAEPVSLENNDTQPAVDTASAASVEPTTPASDVSTATDPKATEPDLLSILNSLGVAAQQSAVSAQVPTTQASTPQVPTEPKSAEPHSWLISDDDAFTRVLSSRENFNQHLQAVYNAAMKQSTEQAQQFAQRASEESLRKIGETVPNQIQHFITLNNMVRDFYKDNPELMPIRQQVGYLANAISTAHPDWSYDQVFAESAKQGKALLGLVAQKTQANGGSTKPAPAFAKPAAARKAEPAPLSGLQKEINELLM